MRKFYSIAINTLVASLGSTLVWFALTIWIYLQTKSVLVTSVLSGFYMASLIFSGIWFGGLVDHHKKRTVMMISDLISGVLFVIGFLIYLSFPITSFQTPSSPQLWIFIFPIFLGVIVSNIRTIALSTVTSFLVVEEKRDKANGMIGTLNGVAYLISPMVGGFLLALSGMFWILFVVIILRFFTFLHLLFTPIFEEQIIHTEKRKHFDFKGTLKIVLSIPGLLGLLLFNCINNFLGGVFMPLIDPYGLSLVSQQWWGLISGILSLGFILGGLFIAKKGLGKNPLRTLFLTNIFMWVVCIFFTIQASLPLLIAGIFLFFCSVPFVEAAEQTIIQKVVPKERQGRVFGFAQSIESAASPLSTLAIGPLAQFFFIPFMTTGAGVDLIGGWFGVGEGRGIALVFTVSGLMGLILTLLGMRTKAYMALLKSYSQG